MDYVQVHQDFLEIMTDLMKRGTWTPGLPALTAKLREVRDSLPPRTALDTPVYDLKLSIRARKTMLRYNIRTLGDLTRTTAAKLLEGKNFGLTTLDEVREELGRQGLKLLNDPDPT